MLYLPLKGLAGLSLSSQIFPAAQQTQRSSGQWSAGRGRTGRLAWPPGSSARGVGMEKGGGSFRLTHLLPLQLLSLSHLALLHSHPFPGLGSKLSN